MTRTIQQLAAGYVALCLTFAGAVGLSPVLHQWIEHGGQGQAHVHLMAQNRGVACPHRHEYEAAHVHSNGQVHSHDEAMEAPAPRGLFAHNVQTLDASATFGEIWRLIVRFIEGSAQSSPDSAPGSDQDRHEHHGLVQLVTSGLVELNVDVTVVDSNLLAVSFDSFPPAALLLEKEWGAQTSSRGPPPAGLTCV